MSIVKKSAIDSAISMAVQSFKTVNVPNGTDPVADSSTDTLNFTSTGGTVTITGDSATDTINFEADAGNSFTTIAVPNGTNPVADSVSDTLTLDSSDDSVVITGTAAIDLIDLQVRYSNPLGNASSEYFGLGATGSGIQQTVMGNGANGAAGTNNTVYGRASTASAAGNDCLLGQACSAGVGGSATGMGNNVTVGTGATAVGAVSNIQLNSVGVGSGTICQDTVTGRNVAIGRTAAIMGTSNNCLAIGTNALVPTGQANVAVFGSDQTPYNDIYLGQGFTSTTASNLALRGSPTTGSNVAGSNVTLFAGNGTGTGGSGEVMIQTAPAAGSSSTPNTMAIVGRVNNAGGWTLGANSTTPTHRINSATDVAGIGAGTLTNVPGAAGNPAGYLTISVNGVTSYIPFWQ